MELKDVLQQMIQENAQAGQPTDIRIGTVTSADPLEITINTQMAPLKASVLYLTESVVEKKIPILEHRHHIDTLSHSHTCPDGGTSTNLSGSYPTLYSLYSAGAGGDQTQNIVCYEFGKPLPIQDGFIILNRALEVGDEVILLRVQNGQKFIVLSRVFKEE